MLVWLKTMNESFLLAALCKCCELESLSLTLFSLTPTFGSLGGNSGPVVSDWFQHSLRICPWKLHRVALNIANVSVAKARHIHWRAIKWQINLRFFPSRSKGSRKVPSYVPLRWVPSGVIQVTEIGFSAPGAVANAFLVTEKVCFMFPQKASMSQKGFKVNVATWS